MPARGWLPSGGVAQVHRCFGPPHPPGHFRPGALALKPSGGVSQRHSFRLLPQPGHVGSALQPSGGVAQRHWYDLLPQPGHFAWCITCFALALLPGGGVAQVHRFHQLPHPGHFRTVLLPSGGVVQRQ